MPRRSIKNAGRTSAVRMEGSFSFAATCASQREAERTTGRPLRQGSARGAAGKRALRCGLQTDRLQGVTNLPKDQDYSQQDEYNYLDRKCGNYLAECDPKLDPLRARIISLEGYIAGAKMRSNWGNLDGLKCIERARLRLREARAQDLS